MAIWQADQLQPDILVTVVSGICSYIPVTDLLGGTICSLAKLTVAWLRTCRKRNRYVCIAIMAPNRCPTDKDRDSSILIQSK